MRVLSKEESFALVMVKFKNLKVKKVIDICYMDRRYPAIVFSIDSSNNTFQVIPLDDNGVDDVLSGRLPKPILIIIPKGAESVHPIWNEI